MDRMSVALDNYITGHYGEDQFSNEDDFFIESVCKNCFMDGKCNIDLAYMNCLVLEDAYRKEYEAERKMYEQMEEHYFNAYIEELIDWM